MDMYCLSTSSLNLPRYVSQEWNNYTLSLNFVGVLLSNQNDGIVWDKNNYNGELATKQAYNVIMEEEVIGMLIM